MFLIGLNVSISLLYNTPYKSFAFSFVLARALPRRLFTHLEPNQLYECYVYEDDK